MKESVLRQSLNLPTLVKLTLLFKMQEEAVDVLFLNIQKTCQLHLEIQDKFALVLIQVINQIYSRKQSPLQRKSTLVEKQFVSKQSILPIQ